VKRYRFRLEAILHLRVAEEELARAALVRAEQELRTALIGRDAELARYRALQPSPGVVAEAVFQGEELASSLAAGSLRVAEHQVGLVAEAAARARVAWSEAARRVAVLERLDQRRRAEHEDDERRADVRTVDDIVTARWVSDRLERQRQGVEGAR
jgi:flagellar biosynthesis chaperone FliJ